MCIDNSKCSCESDAFERLISCEKLQCVKIACFAVSKHYPVIFFSTLFHKLLLFYFFFCYKFSQHCHLRMADVDY